jgi:hypothetical protein
MNKDELVDILRTALLIVMIAWITTLHLRLDRCETLWQQQISINQNQVKINDEAISIIKTIVKEVK